MGMHCAKLIRKRLGDCFMVSLPLKTVTQSDTETASFVEGRQTIPMKGLSNETFQIKLRSLPSVKSWKVLSCKDVLSIIN